jgi:hypothetical protein
MSNIPQTPNFKLYKPPFDRKAWHDYVNKNFATIDAVLTTYLDVGNIVGVWDNSTAYLTGDRVIDPEVGQVFEAAQNNTSAATGTFADDRAANPTYWTSLAVTARGLGAWAPATLYQPNDFVVAGSIYAVCLATHTSSAVFADDAVFWDYLIDISTAPIIPSFTGHSLELLRVNAGETGAEWASVANVQAWLGLDTAAFLPASTFATSAHNHVLANISDMSADARTFNAAANFAAMRTALQVPNIAGDTFTGGVTISNIAPDPYAHLALLNVDASALSGPVIELFKDSSSPAANDVMGVIRFYGRDSANNKQQYGYIYNYLFDPTSGAEIGELRFGTQVSSGVAQDQLQLREGVIVGTLATTAGGYKGFGTLNIDTGLYIGGEPVGQTITFSADKGGAGADTLVTPTDVKITFGTENWDIGAAFATSTWTPPAGKYRINACVNVASTNGVDNELLRISLYKNGATHRMVEYHRPGAASTVSLPIDAIVDANGTDTFEIYVAKGGAGNGATSTAASLNFFQGTAL